VHSGDVTWDTESDPTGYGNLDLDWGYVEGTLSGFTGLFQKMKLRASALEFQDNQEHTTHTNAYISHNQLVRDYVRTGRE
jgi:hypothetical protein